MTERKSKNWIVRAAGFLFALVLISSCFVGSTFAKYVTAASGSETARVAKFGVTVAASNNTMFKTAYATDNEGVKASIENSVVSSDTDKGKDKLVAPGTSEAGTAIFSVTGTPEVAVNVAVSLNTDTLKDVFLKGGKEYTDYTSAAADAKFTLAEDYYPVKFTLTQNDAEVVTNGTLSDVNQKLAEVSMNYAPNTDLSKELGTYKLSWKWDFNGNDQADTLLGNLAAGTATEIDTADYSTQIAFDLSITVTQID